MPAWLTQPTSLIMARKPARKPPRAPQAPQGALALFNTFQAREDPRAARRAAAEASLAEVDARRCVICGCEGPAWGYGPPLVEQQVWSCFAHRNQVDPRSPEAIPDWLR